MKKRSTFSRAGFWLIMAIILVGLVFPFFYMVLSSFKTTVDMFNMDKMFNFRPTVENYIEVFGRYNFASPLKNTAIVSVLSTAFSLLLGVPASYSIARHKQHLLSNIVLSVRIIPGIAFLVPWYLIFTKIKLNGTFASLILCHMLIAMPYIVWIMIPYFEKIPIELEESAVVDGCSKMKSFVNIVLPIATPGLITSTILVFISSWNNFIFGLVLGSAKTQPLPVAVFHFIADTEVNWGGLMAASVVITLPIIVIAMLLQRYIIAGLTAGAVKG